MTRDDLIVAHLPQVQQIARNIRRRLPRHVLLEDLVSIGVIGLIYAIDHFDASKGAQLKTYAEHRIRGAILDSRRRAEPATEALTVEQPERNTIIFEERIYQGQLLRKACDAISPKERRLLAMVYANDLTLTAIAKLQGVSSSYACRSHSVALRRIRTRLGVI